MNTAVINIRTSKTLKTQAQQVAEGLGFSLSTLITAYLKQLTKDKTVYFSLVDEVPNRTLVAALKQAEADRKTGRAKRFDSKQAALDYLDALME
jgi:addiction module RelB/DinJ family antitoxin